MAIDAADAAERYFLWWRAQFEANGNPENAKTSPAELGSYLGAAYDRDKESRRLFLKLSGSEYIASFDDLPDFMLNFSVLGSSVPAFKTDDVMASIEKAIKQDKGDYFRFFEKAIVDSRGEVSYEGIKHNGVSVSAVITNPSLYLPGREGDLFKAANKYLIKPLSLSVPSRS